MCTLGSGDDPLCLQDTGFPNALQLGSVVGKCLLLVHDTASFLKLVLKSGPIQNDLAGVAGAHGFKALLVILDREPVGDDFLQGEAGLHHGLHFVPGFVHLSTVNALQDEAVPDDGVQGELHGVFIGQAQEGDPTPVVHGFNELPQGDGVAGHLHAHVKALVNPQVRHNLFQVRLLGVHGYDAKLPGQLQPVFVEIRNHHMPRPGEFGNGCRQDADGAGASNQHILRQEVEGQGGMGGIAEGIKDGVQLLRNLGGAGNDVGGGNYQVLCEGAVPVDADARGVFTQVPPAGAAVTAHAADDVPLAGDQLAQVMSLYGGAHFHDFADILMPGSGAHPEGILRPLIPVPDVYDRGELVYKPKLFSW